MTGHSVVHAWARAVERAGTFDSDTVLAKLEEFSDEPLLAGLTTYTPELHTNLGRPMLIFSFENGKPGPLGYYDPRSGEYVKVVDRLAEASGLARSAVASGAAASERAGGQQLLECRDVSVHFEGVTALQDVSLSIRPGACLGLIGPNGAGKTTLINVLTGFQWPGSGRIAIGDTDITRWRPDRIARAGVVRTFQGVRLFPGLSVSENVEASAAATGAWPQCGPCSRH